MRLSNRQTDGQTDRRRDALTDASSEYWSRPAASVK